MSTWMNRIQPLQGDKAALRNAKLLSIHPLNHLAYMEHLLDARNCTKENLGPSLSRYEHPPQETTSNAPGMMGGHLYSVQGISNEIRKDLIDE